MSVTVQILLLHILTVSAALWQDNSDPEDTILLITGGGGSSSSKEVEVLSLADQPISCEISVPDLPVFVRTDGSTFFLHDKDPVYCLGLGGRKGVCFKYSPEKNDWEEFTTLTASRHSAAKLELPGYILITGGVDFDKLHKTVDCFDPIAEKFVPGPDLPYPAHLHCIAPINRTHAILTGGTSHENSFVNFAYIFNKKTMEWTELSPMQQNRGLHACGMVGPSKMFVAGGAGQVPKNGSTGEEIEFLSSVEVFDLETQTWSAGQELPQPIAGATAVQLENTILLVGGFYDPRGGDLDTVFSYNVENNEWVLRNERLQQFRTHGPAAWKLPASYLNCTIEHQQS